MDKSSPRTRGTLQLQPAAKRTVPEITCVGTGIVSHAGTVLLAEIADRIGLTALLGEATNGLRVGADVDGDAHQRHGADQQEYAPDEHGRGVTPPPASPVAEQPSASCGVCHSEQQQDSDGHGRWRRRLGLAEAAALAL